MKRLLPLFIVLMMTLASCVPAGKSYSDFAQTSATPEALSELEQTLPITPQPEPPEAPTPQPEPPEAPTPQPEPTEAPTPRPEPAEPSPEPSVTPEPVPEPSTGPLPEAPAPMFASKSIEDAVCYMLEKTPEQITEADLASIELLEISGDETNGIEGLLLSSLEDLLLLPNLMYLRIEGFLGLPQSWSVLGGLPITYLEIVDCPSLNNIEFVESLPQLDTLVVAGARITDIRPISAVASTLTQLQLSSCRVNDLSALSGLNELIYLDVSDNMLDDISPVSGLEKLEVFAASGNLIADLKPLEKLGGLKALIVNSNRIAGHDAVSALSGLEYCDVSDNLITSFSSLKKLTKVGYLFVDNNPATALTPLLKLPALENLRVDEQQAEKYLDDLEKAEYLVDVVPLDAAS